MNGERFGRFHPAFIVNSPKGENRVALSGTPSTPEQMQVEQDNLNAGSKALFVLL